MPPLALTNTGRLFLLFPSILISGLFIRGIIKLLGTVFDPIDIPLVSRRGILNRGFAGHSFEIFLALFAMITTYVCIYKSTSINYSDSTTVLLPVVGTDVVQNPNLPATQSKPRMVARQFSKLLILYVYLTCLIVWFFGDPIFERILKATGGHCSNDDGSLGYHQCLADGENTWVGGTKISGHSLILSCFSTTILFELLHLARIYKINAANEIYGPRLQGTRVLYRAIQFIVCAVAFIWCFMYLITSIFYHTIFEKIVGTLCGLAIPYLFNVKYDAFFNFLL